MAPSDEDIAFRSNIPAPVDIMVAVVYSIFGVCSVLGNSTLLYVSYKKKHLLKPAEYFIVNLAVSDLGLTVSLYPMAIASSFYHRWLYGKTVCYLYAFCGMLFGICSLTTLTLLSTVCFVKVCYPFYGNRFNSVHGCLLIACAWVYALLFAGSPLADWGKYGPEPYGTACCIDWRLSNQHSTARSYTVALFIFCYILPCCIIVASYSNILMRVHSSRKHMERHSSRQAHMTSIQTIIVKLSVAICIGFLAAWSPYAVVSMWAAFGPVDSIPPLAFAMPAMFAKSSTIYNPIIYLTLRPNIRRVMCRDLGTLYRACVKCCCCCSEGPVRVRLGTVHRHTSGFPVPPPGQPPIVTLKAPSCDEDAKIPQMCSVSVPTSRRESSKGPDGSPEPKTLWGKAQRGSRKKSLLATVWAKRTSEIDNLHINLEMVPGTAKVAWP
ncbi:opsin 7, group member a [Takifugu flavidus]|nr:opsin 7, group member a [Takifugu flavidus]